MTRLANFDTGIGISAIETKTARFDSMRNLTLLFTTTLAATSGLLFGTMKGAFALNWNWNYSGTGITALGTFTTNDTPNDLGFYQISGITGKRNGETITGLQAIGTPIPGN